MVESNKMMEALDEAEDEERGVLLEETHEESNGKSVRGYGAVSRD